MGVGHSCHPVILGPSTWAPPGLCQIRDLTSHDGEGGEAGEKELNPCAFSFLSPKEEATHKSGLGAGCLGPRGVCARVCVCMFVCARERSEVGVGTWRWRAGCFCCGENNTLAARRRQGV